MNARGIAVGAVVALLAVAAVDEIGDLTQTRPDRPQSGSRTEVVFDVRTRDPRRSALQAAQGLWGACQGTIERRTHPADVAVDGRRATVILEPPLGTHGKQRLRGCLHDLTIDRVKARVVTMRTVLR